jgi:hypothetical protein
MISLIKNSKQMRLFIFAATTSLLVNASLCFAVENERRSINDIPTDALAHILRFLGPRECTQAGRVSSFWHEASDSANQQRESITIDCSANPRIRRDILLLQDILANRPKIKSLSLITPVRPNKI